MEEEVHHWQLYQRGVGVAVREVEGQWYWRKEEQWRRTRGQWYFQQRLLLLGARTERWTVLPPDQGWRQARREVNRREKRRRREEGQEEEGSREMNERGAMPRVWPERLLYLGLQNIK